MDYRVYRLSFKEILGYGFLYLVMYLIFAKLFYDSFLVAAIGILWLPVLFRMKAQELMKKRKEQLALEFKEFITALSASLKTGYSAENALSQAHKDMICMYGEESFMSKECLYIEKQLLNNKPLEVLLAEFAERSGEEEIRDFAAVFLIAKRSGGNMANIIRNTTDIIGEKMDVKREIQLLYAAKRMEQSIMNIVPLAMIAFVRITTPGYFDVMYGNPFGILVMTICLVVYAGAFFLARNIIDIEV